MSMRFVSCEDCPCRRIDPRWEEDSCGLNYIVDSARVGGDWIIISPNCELKEVKSRARVFTPTVLTKKPIKLSKASRELAEENARIMGEVNEL